MKNIIKSLCIIVVSFSTISCMDFLTEVDPNAITVPTFWKNEDDALKGIAAAYGGLQQGFVSGSGQAGSLVRSDLARSNPWENVQISLENFTYNETNDYITKNWNQLYIGVFRANQVIDFVPNIKMNEDTKATIIAEAHFLRGLYFFWLMNTFNNGSVVIPTSYPKSSEEYNLPLSSKEEVYAQIEKDFKYAAAEGALPESWETDMLGRATWGAATGLLGKFYLYNEKWDLAAAEFKKIIDRTDLYSLVPEIGWNFDIAHEWNSESLFEVNFSDVVREGFTGYNYDRTDGQGAEATVRGLICAPGQFGGYSVVVPTGHARELFMSDKPDFTNPINEPGRVYSKRTEASVFFYGATYPYYHIDEEDGEKYDFNLYPSRIYIKKFQNWWDEKEDNVTQRSGINERILRLADVYLMYAEALVQRDGDAGAAEAMLYINKVRTRAGVLNLNYTTKDEIMKHLMYTERPLELAYEGHAIRWNDLRRWKITKEHLGKLSKTLYHFDVLEIPDSPSFYEFKEAAKNFTDANYYLPIPNSETNSNPYINNK